jgi:predicted unusual protein kinase regulating ubiquinone biosynthesis (AarF/ABC1/UbiB family)
MLGQMAAGLAGDLAGAAGRVVAGTARDAAAARLHEQAAGRLLETLGRMKGLPMKLGQLLSYLDDFIPPEHRTVYREVLGKLQAQAPPMGWKEMAAVIETDLGAPPDAIFAAIDPEPIAAASIGQVYRARARDGREVAVKVQYPGIADAIRADLENVGLLRAALSLVLPKLDVEQSIADLTARVLEECDYGCELNNQEDFADIWQGDDEVRVPRVVSALSSDHVLTSELVVGDTFAAAVAGATPAERSRYGLVIYRFVFESLYLHGVFNGDPHPGNYLFLPGGRVAFVDFGCVQRFPPDAVREFQRVRHLVFGGVRGAPLWDAMVHAYGLPADSDAAERSFLERYLVCCFEPVLRDEVFRFDRTYTEKLADLTMEGALLGARKALRKGVREAKRPGIIFLNRIQIGLASVLAQLGAEANFRRMIDQVDARLAVARPVAS